jgi:hypothetical protein
MSKRIWFLSFGDTHGNCRFGLMKPGIVLPPQDDEGEEWIPELTTTQEWIYDQFINHIDGVMSLVGNDELFVCHGGEPTHGDIYHDKEKVSTRRYDEFKIAIETLGIVAQIPNVKRWRFAKGTGSHVYGHGTAELMIAEMMRDKYGIDARAYYHPLIEICGKVFDVSHHGPGTGIRNWLKGNVLRLYVRSLMMDELMAGRRPPDVVLRHHFHDYVPETVKIRANGKTHTTMAAVVPSYCGITDFGRKAVRSPSKLTVGMLLYEIYRDRLLEPYEFISTLDLRKKERFE